MTSRADVSLILRRAAFTPTRAEVDVGLRLGSAKLVESLLAAAPDSGAVSTPPPELDSPAELVRGLAKSADMGTRKAVQKRARRQSLELTAWWVRRMVAAERPFAEKLAFFWHGHFATSVQKVRSPALMLGQQDVFRRAGLGPFPQLMLAVAEDPAMLRWLDAGKSSKSDPNENFAREMFELFVLGHGSYSEEDVRQAARAFTGWRWRPATGFGVVGRQHDDGTKTVLGRSGNFSGQDVISLATSLPAAHRWVVSRIWSRYVSHAAPTDPTITRLVDRLALTDATPLADVFRAVLLAPELTSPAVRTGLVKQPVEWVVGAQRALNAAVPDRVVLSTLQSLGQVPFAPASVGGWPEGTAWLSTSATAAKVAFAQQVVAKTDLGPLEDVAAPDRPDAAADLLAVDAWSAQTRRALHSTGGDPARLLAIALISPDYQLA